MKPERLQQDRELRRGTPYMHANARHARRSRCWGWRSPRPRLPLVGL